MSRTSSTDPVWWLNHALIMIAVPVSGKTPRSISGLDPGRSTAISTYACIRAILPQAYSFYESTSITSGGRLVLGTIPSRRHVLLHGSLLPRNGSSANAWTPTLAGGVSGKRTDLMGLDLIKKRPTILTYAPQVKPQRV